MSVIRDAITHLQEVEQVLAELGPLENATDKASAEYDQAASALTDIKSQLNDAKAGLSLAHVKNLRDYEESIFGKAQQSKDLDAKITDQQFNTFQLKSPLQALLSSAWSASVSLSSLSTSSVPPPLT